MSKLSLFEDKKIITLNPDGQAQINIINSPNPNNPNNQHPIIFKIKANMIQNIAVKPSYGILMHSGNQSNKKIHVKYSGQKEDLKKVKLQIRWLKLPRNLQTLSQEGKKVMYPEIYRECQTKDGQKYEEITFQFQQQSSKADANNIEPKQFRFQSKMYETKQQRVTQMQKKICFKAKSQTKSNSENITFKQVLLLIFFSLLLGMCFGIKFNRIEKEELRMEIEQGSNQNLNGPQL